MVERTVRRIVEGMTASAPPGWRRAVLVSTAGRDGVGVAGGYSVPGQPRWRIPVSGPYEELRTLAEEARRARGWERVSVEVECRPSGEYRMVAWRDAVTSLRGRDGGFQAVLDPAYRLPEPGLAQDEGTAAPAGDPDLARTRLLACLERRAAALGRTEVLPPPASAAALEDAERRIGRALPADLRALYQVADGDGEGLGHRYLLGGDAWLSLRHLVTVYARLQEPAPAHWELDWDAVVHDADPPGTVRRCGGHPGWVPFASGEDGNYLAVDLSPAVGGRPGQVIRIGRDHHRQPAYVADSVTALLGHQLEQLERGLFETYDDEPYDTNLMLLEPVPRVSDGGRPWIADDRIPDELPHTLQCLHLHDAPAPVDLTPLAAAPGLRLLHLNRCSAADLTPLRALPIESLRLTLVGGSLAPLRAHPHLTSLGVSGSTPVDVAVLRTVPNLRALDLSQVPVADLSVLSELPELRYLSLSGRQWAALLDAGHTPPALAAARLSDDDATLEQALAWTARLGLDPSDALRTTGSLTPATGRQETTSGGEPHSEPPRRPVQ
ncbi:SMI1/KNR4 family protein [Streptomyces mobaraensis]|uniref:SMI1/KNR4 family protein n=1 Tax=Streptomyces mobaraensis TaxID=35621 RepID=UPI00331AE455